MEHDRVDDDGEAPLQHKKKGVEHLSLEERRQMVERIRFKHPDRVPIIVQKAPRSDIPEASKRKFIVPGDVPVARFLFELKRYINSNKAVFLFVGRATIPRATDLMAHVYVKHRSEDGFLYITYAADDPFGHPL